SGKTTFGSGSEPRLRVQARRAAEQQRCFANGRLVEHQHEHAGEPHAETTVGRHTVAEEVEVFLELSRLETLFNCLSFEYVNTVLTLGTGRDLDAAEDEVV